MVFRECHFYVSCFPLNLLSPLLAIPSFRSCFFHLGISWVSPGFLRLRFTEKERFWLPSEVASATDERPGIVGAIDWVDGSMSSTMSRDNSLKNTYCSRGHIHPPWNTTGVLRIAKCESVCGFCQKETKTAANLRKVSSQLKGQLNEADKEKHVAIHIKNEGMNLSIAEGSSGRGRLFVSPLPSRTPR
jgi:hypothetical protein